MSTTIQIDEITKKKLLEIKLELEREKGKADTATDSKHDGEPILPIPTPTTNCYGNCLLFLVYREY